MYLIEKITFRGRERDREWIHDLPTRLSDYWSRYAVRWITSAGVFLALASFTFVVCSFLVFQLQTMLE